MLHCLHSCGQYDLTSIAPLGAIHNLRGPIMNNVTRLNINQSKKNSLTAQFHIQVPYRSSNKKSKAYKQFLGPKMRMKY